MMYNDDPNDSLFAPKVTTAKRKIAGQNIHYINPKIKEKTKNRTIRKRRANAPVLIATFVLAAALTTGVKLANALQPADPQPFIPSGYILTEVTDKVESGDTITGIASEYYDSNTYAGMYSTPIAYKNAILEQNNLKDSSTIYPGDSVEIPVVIDINNEFYIKMQAVREAIRKIENENLWVDYVLQSGEGILDLAAKASGSVNETYTIASRIREKNSDSNFWVGETVSIMNPELGQLKMELKSLEQALQESLKVNAENKSEKLR